MNAKKTKAEAREVKKRKRMPVSGKTVFGIKKIISNKSSKKAKNN